MDHPIQPADLDGPRVMSLCSGFGFLDLAVRLAIPAARTICMVEREGYALEVLAHEMEEGRLDPAPLWTDLFTFDPEPWRGAVDIVVAGFPCQPASLAGKREGVNDDRWIWPRIADILEAVAAPYVFLENVPGLLTVSGGTAFGEVLSDLAQMGFDTEYGLLRASDVGATHKRERLFIFCRNRDLVDAQGFGHPLVEALLDREQTVGGAVARAGGGAAPGDHAEGVRARIQLDAAGTPYLQPVLLGAGPLADGGGERRQQVTDGASGDEGADGGRHSHGGDLAPGAGEGLGGRGLGDLVEPEGLGRGEGRPEHARVEGRPDAAVADGLDGRGSVADPERGRHGGRASDAERVALARDAATGTGEGDARRGVADPVRLQRGRPLGETGRGRGVREVRPELDEGGRVADSDDGGFGARVRDLQAGQSDPEGRGEGDARGELGDAGLSGLPLGRGPAPAGLQRATPERAGDRLDGAGRRALDDAERAGLERRGGLRDLASETGVAQAEGLQREWRRRALGHPGPGSLPLFPPGPRSLRWVDVAYHRPDLFPALTPDGRIPASSPFYPFFIAGERDRQAQPALRGLADGRGDDDGSGPRLPSYGAECDCPRTDILRGLGNGVVPHQAAIALLVLAGRMGWRDEPWAEVSQETAPRPCVVDATAAQLTIW